MNAQGEDVVAGIRTPQDAFGRNQGWKPGIRRITSRLRRESFKNSLVGFKEQLSLLDFELSLLEIGLFPGDLSESRIGEGFGCSKGTWG